MDPSPALQLFSLRGQNVLVTGASRGTRILFTYKTVKLTLTLIFKNFLSFHIGIGAACAIALAQAGASVCLVQRLSTDGTDPNLDTLNTIRAFGATAEVVYCDLGDLQAVKLLFQKAVDVMGGEISVLVNCAGVQRRSPCLHFSESDWDDVCTNSLEPCTAPCITRWVSSPSAHLLDRTFHNLSGRPIFPFRSSTSTSNPSGCFAKKPVGIWYPSVEAKLSTSVRYLPFKAASLSLPMPLQRVPSDNLPKPSATSGASTMFK
jgi:hypothetical protein